MMGTNNQFKDDFYVAVSTGDAWISLVTPEIGESVELYSTTGDIDFRVTNPTYSSNVSNWIGELSTGSIWVSVEQSNPISTNITGNFHATTGDIDIRMDLDTSIGARFSSSVVTGDYDYSSGEGFEILGNVFQTTPYPRASNYDLHFKCKYWGYICNWY